MVQASPDAYLEEDARVLRWLLATAHTGADRLLVEAPDVAARLRAAAEQAEPIVTRRRRYG